VLTGVFSSEPDEPDGLQLFPESLTQFTLLLEGLPPPIRAEHLFGAELDQLRVVSFISGDELAGPFGW